MRKFSTIFNEARQPNTEEYIRRHEATFSLSRNIDDEPEDYRSTLDMLETFKESYDVVDNVEISKGFVTNKRLENAPSVNSIQLLSRKKVRAMFPNGSLPDKWKVAIKAILTFKKMGDFESLNFNGVNEGQIFDISTVDIMIQRYKSIKTLGSRCEHYGGHVKISYSSTYVEKVSLLIFFDN